MWSTMLNAWKMPSGFSGHFLISWHHFKNNLPRMATLWQCYLCSRGESYSPSSWPACIFSCMPNTPIMGKAWFLHENQWLKNSAEKNVQFSLRFDSILNRNLRLLNHVTPSSSYQYILKGFMENSTCPHLAPYPLHLSSWNNSTKGESCCINALCFLPQYMDQTAQGKP